MARIISAAEAVELMHDGMTLGVSGFGAFASPDTILDAMGESFRAKGTPRALTIVSGVAPGDFREDGCGLSKIKDEGIIDTLIASHLRMSPAIGRACSENRIAAYTMPLGLYGQLMAAIGGHRPGIITHVGLGTYADPRQEGCRINDRAKEQGREIVRLMQIDGKDYLFYKAFRIDACILHASYADEDGNISAQSEPIRSDLLELAAAVHNNGGTVIVEVNEIVKAGSLDPKQVLIHKSYVDYIVRAKKQDNIALEYSPQLTGDIRMPDGQGVAPLPMGFKKVIARRAAMELQPGMLVNLGIGIPASVANVANEEGLSGKLTLSLETGVYGGVPLDGPLFGAAVNPDSISLRQRERLQIQRALRRSRWLCEHLPEHTQGAFRLLLHLRQGRHRRGGRQARHPPRRRRDKVQKGPRPHHLLRGIRRADGPGRHVHNRARRLPRP